MPHTKLPSSIADFALRTESSFPDQRVILILVPNDPVCANSYNGTVRFHCSMVVMVSKRPFPPSLISSPHVYLTDLNRDIHIATLRSQITKTRRGSRGGFWGARPHLGRSFTIQNALFHSIQAPVHHWAPIPGKNPVSAPKTTCVHLSMEI